MQPSLPAIPPAASVPADKPVKPDLTRYRSPVYIAGLSAEQVAVMSVLELKLMAPPHIALVPHFDRLPPQVLGALSPGRLRRLSAAQRKAMTARQLQALSVVQRRALPRSERPTNGAALRDTELWRIASLTGSQLGGIRHLASSLSPLQFSILNRAQLNGLIGDGLRLGTPQINAMPARILAALRWEQLRCLRKALDLDGADGREGGGDFLCAEQMYVLTPLKAKVLIGDRPPSVGALEALTLRQAMALDPALFDALPAAKLAALSPLIIRALRSSARPSGAAATPAAAGQPP